MCSKILPKFNELICMYTTYIYIFIYAYTLIPICICICVPVYIYYWNYLSIQFLYSMLVSSLSIYFYCTWFGSYPEFRSSSLPAYHVSGNTLYELNKPHGFFCSWMWWCIWWQSFGIVLLPFITFQFSNSISKLKYVSAKLKVPIWKHRSPYFCFNFNHHRSLIFVAANYVWLWIKKFNGPSNYDWINADAM